MKTKKWIVLLLSFAMVLSLLAGCGQKNVETDGKGNSQSTETEKKDESKQEETQNSEETAPEDVWTWPLAETKELSVWLNWSNEYTISPNDLLGIQEIEKNTNVHVNWVTVSDADATEKFGLMIASGDIPDIIRSANSYYVGGLAKMVDDGVSIDLTEMVEKNMPNYMALVNAYPQLQKDTISDEGKRYAVFTITSDFGKVRGERAWGGLVVRQDWLDSLGMAMPETIDDWQKVLTAFKEEKGADAPLLIGANGTDFYGNWVTAYGVGSSFYQDNGTVKYGPAEPGYKDFLATFRQWYAEGLIDPNFVSNDASMMGSFDYLAMGRAGASPNLVGLTATVLPGMGFPCEEGFFLSAAPYPVLNSGDTPYVLANMSDLLKEAIVVTANCEDPELACRWLDYWYTEDAMMLDTLGIEGDSYVINDNGEVELTQKLIDMQADYGNSILSALGANYTLVTSHFGLYNWAGLDIASPGETNAQSLTWDVASRDMALPTYMTMNEEEALLYAAKFTDIQTLTQEYTVKAITGAVDLEGDYENFLSQLEAYGLADCLQCQQSALDRYNAR